MERRTLLLIASTLVAALGTALIWLYVQGADQRAQEGQELVSVWVPKQTVAVGATADDVRDQLIRTTLPRNTVLQINGMITDPNQITGFAKQELPQGVPLVNSQFGDAPSAVVSLAREKLAMQVSLGDPQRAAGLLQPGSYITIFAIRSRKQQGQGGQEEPVSAFVVLKNVKVLSAEGVTRTPSAAQPASRGTGGTGTGAGSADPQVPEALVALEVDQEQAQKIILAQALAEGATGNTLYFALRGGPDVKLNAGVPGETILTELFNGEG